jgi:hypothetical protein
MVGFLSLILRVKTIRHAIKAVKSGERGRPGNVCQADRREQAGNYSTGQADKIFEEGKSRTFLDSSQEWGSPRVRLITAG